MKKHISAIFNKLDERNHPIPDLKVDPVSPWIDSNDTAWGHHSMFDHLKDCRQEREPVNIPVSDLCSYMLPTVQNFFSDNLMRSYHERAKVSLADISHLGACREGAHSYPSIDDLGERSFQDHKNKLTIKDPKEYAQTCLTQALAHSHSVVAPLWKKDIQWQNSGGGHRFSCAHYLNDRYGFNLSFETDVRIEKINTELLRQTLEHHKGFITQVHDDSNDWVSHFKGHDSGVIYFDIDRPNTHHPFAHGLGSPVTETPTRIILASKTQTPSPSMQKWLNRESKLGTLKPLENWIREIEDAQLRQSGILNYIGVMKNEKAPFGINERAVSKIQFERPKPMPFKTKQRLANS